MKSIRLLLVTMFLTALALPVFGGDYGSVTVDELKAMVDRNEPGLMIIDSRSRSQFEEEHIKGAISIPLAEMEQNPELPKAQKDARLVFYCSGNTWRGSSDAARVAAQRGFTNVSVLKKGLPVWQAAGYPVEHTIQKQ